jgi:hypothetical protein
MLALLFSLRALMIGPACAEEDMFDMVATTQADLGKKVKNITFGKNFFALAQCIYIHI